MFLANFMIIIDGLWDNEKQNEILQNKLPNFDGFSLLYKGFSGYFKNSSGNRPVDSLNCISTLLGIPENLIPKGRAYMEALANGILPEDNDLILRCNLITLDEEKIIISNSAKVSETKAKEVFEFLNQKFNHKGFYFYHTGSYRGLLLLKNKKYFSGSLNFQPPHENIGKRLKVFSQGPYGDILNEIISESQRGGKEITDINLSVSLWSEAIKESLPSYENYINGRTAIISGTSVVNGIGKSMGIDIYSDKEFTGDTDTNLNKKLNLALSLKKDYENIIIHINGADEASHRKNFEEKLNFLKKTGKVFINEIINKSESKDRFLVCSDHSSDSQTGSHIGDNQMFWLYYKDIIANKTEKIINGKQAFLVLSNREEY